MDARYVKSIIETGKVLDAQGISWTYQSEGSSDVAVARELTACGTSKTLGYDVSEFGLGAYTYEKVFWIDSDVAWTPGDFLRLLGSPLDVVGAAAMMDDGETVTARLSGVGRNMTRDEVLSQGGVFEVEGIGFSFLSVRQGVFEAIGRPWFKYSDFPILDGQVVIHRGEDYSWCDRVRDTGFSIYLDPNVQIAHMKQIGLVLGF